MKKFTIYNSEGKILRSGFCTTSSFKKKAGNGEFVIEGIGNDVTQKVVGSGQSRRIVNKSSAEMAGLRIPIPKSAPYEKQLANITNEQWQDVLDRLSKLETRT